jgi:hypothetical protein
MQRAAQLSLAGHVDDAVDAWALAVQAAPSDDLAQLRLQHASSLLRADRPTGALQVLQQVDEHTLTQDQAVQRQLQLAGALMDVGQPDLSERVAQETLPQVEGSMVPLVLDGMAGARYVRGDVLGLQQIQAALSRSKHMLASWSAKYWGGRLARLQGRLDQAQDTWAGLAETLEHSDHPGAGVGQARVLSALAELAVVQGNPQDALVLLDRVVTVWTARGRRGPLFAAEALRAEAALQMGATVLPSMLDAPVEFADERGLQLLGARVRLVRAMSRAHARSDLAPVDFDAALLLAATSGAPLLAGRVRLERAMAGYGAEGGPLRLQELDHCVDDLTGDRVWCTRAMLSRARFRLSAGDPAGAMREAGRVLARLESMGLHADVEEARAILDAAG